MPARPPLPPRRERPILNNACQFLLLQLMLPSRLLVASQPGKEGWKLLGWVLLGAVGCLAASEVDAPQAERIPLQMPGSVAQGQSLILRLAAGAAAAPRVRFRNREFAF